MDYPLPFTGSLSFKEKMAICSNEELQAILDSIIYCIREGIYSWLEAGPYGQASMEDWYLNIEAELNVRNFSPPVTLRTKIMKIIGKRDLQ